MPIFEFEYGREMLFSRRQILVAVAVVLVGFCAGFLRTYSKIRVGLSID
jgi:hypothetical protein